MTRKKPTKAKPKPRAAPKPKTVSDPDKLPDASVPLSNARHERFCWNLTMHGMSQTQAYILAGYAVTEDAARRYASDLVRTKPDIFQRLTFLKSQAAALAIDAASLTKADILAMTVEQHQRNVGVRAVTVTKPIKSGKDKGKLVTFQTFAYNEHAANQTLKLLHDEWGLGAGGSSGSGAGAGDIAARARLDNPDIVQQLDGLRATRKLVLAGGTEVDGETALEKLRKASKG